MGSLAGDKQLFIPLGFYKGCKVAIKRINQKSIHLNRELMLELKRVIFSSFYSISMQLSIDWSLVFADERYTSRAFGKVLWCMC